MTAVIRPEYEEVFSRAEVALYAYLTPKGEPLCWPVTPFWFADKKRLGVATGVAYPNKAVYAREHPRVAMMFGEGRGPVLCVRGDAEVFDDDIQANTDRYITELRRKSPAARMGINRLTLRLLDFYLPRLWVEIAPHTIELPATGGGSTVVEGGLSGPLHGFKACAVTWTGEDGGPEVAPALIESSMIHARLPPGPVCLTFHRHRLGSLSLTAFLVRGRVEEERFVASRVVPFFGNGAFLPLAALPSVPRLRGRMKRELQRRGSAMPILRMPRE